MFTVILLFLTKPHYFWLSCEWCPLSMCPFHLCSISFSMRGGHGSTLTFNPNGERTQVDREPLGKQEL